MIMYCNFVSSTYESIAFGFPDHLYKFFPLCEQLLQLSLLFIIDSMVVSSLSRICITPLCATSKNMRRFQLMLAITLILHW